MTLAMHLEAFFFKKKKTNGVMPKSICKQLLSARTHFCSQLLRVFALGPYAILLSDRTQFWSQTVRIFALGQYAILLSDRCSYSFLLSNRCSYPRPTGPPYRSNGHAERSVQTVKNILRNASDPLLAMLIYRSTPLPWCKLSPAELLMGRKLLTYLPILSDQLKPKCPYLKEFQMQDDRVKKNSKMNFDRQHKAQSLPRIPDDASVWITNERHQPAPGKVIEQAATPRSYIVTTEDGGQVRRNRQHLNIIPENPVTLPGQEEVTQQRQETEAAEREPVQVQQTQPIVTRSQIGAGIHPPQRYGMFVTHLGKEDVVLTNHCIIVCFI